MSYDDWKGEEPEPFYMSEKDMSAVDGLERVNVHLRNAARELDAAKRQAILHRGRLSRIDTLETETYDIVADIDEELSYRR